MDEPTLTDPHAQADLLEVAIAEYKSLATDKKLIEQGMEAARKQLTDLLREFGLTKAVTPSGSVQFIAGSERASWDDHALCVLMQSNAQYEALLRPYRSVKPVAGGLRIT